MQSESKELLTIKEAAEVLGVSEISVKRYIASETIPSVLIGRSRRIVKDDLWNALVEKMKQEKESKKKSPETASGKPKPDVFNSLTPTEWAMLSKNVINEEDLFNPVWDDLSSARNKYQLEHGAVYPVKLAERLIRMYSREGDCVFDPFLGIGSTLIAAHNLNRQGIGLELNPKFARIANEWLNEVQGMFGEKEPFRIYNDDCRNILAHVEPDSVQVTVTSPPYANFIHKSVEDRTTAHKSSFITYENNSTVKPYSAEENDFGNLEYNDFLAEIKGILRANYEITKNKGYSAWVVKDYRDTKRKIPYVPFHSDLARLGEEVGWKYHDLIIWDQSGQRKLILLGYPSVLYTNQNCSFIVVFRKV